MLQFLQDNIAIILAIQFAQIGYIFYLLNHRRKQQDKLNEMFSFWIMNLTASMFVEDNKSLTENKEKEVLKD